MILLLGVIQNALAQPISAHSGGFAKSLEAEYFPDQWKIANVVALYKRAPTATRATTVLCPCYASGSTVIFAGRVLSTAHLFLFYSLYFCGIRPTVLTGNTTHRLSPMLARSAQCGVDVML